MPSILPCLPQGLTKENIKEKTISFTKGALVSIAVSAFALGIFYAASNISDLISQTRLANSIYSFNPNLSKIDRFLNIVRWVGHDAINSFGETLVFFAIGAIISYTLLTTPSQKKEEQKKD